MGTTTKLTFCRICEALCGLEVDVTDGRVSAIRPDPDHVVTRGFACPKGLHQHEIYDAPDRLRVPLRRTGTGHEPVSWEVALAEIGGKLRSLVDAHGPDTVGMYVGTAAGFSALHPVFAQGFMQGLGSGSMFSSASQDCSNKFAVARAMYGFPFTQPFPDVDRTECLIVVGANPVVSKWSFLQVSNPVARLKEITGRGGRVFIVDPRRTETAKVAGEHVFIRPGTDLFFYLAFLQELVRQGGVDRPRVRQTMRGFDQVEALVAPWTPERVESVTRIPAARLREMVTAYRTAWSAALYSSTGVNMGGAGSLCFWLQEVINAVSGNLDRPGGTLVAKGIIDFTTWGKKNGVLGRDDPSRFPGYRTTNDAFPGGLLADEILTPGRGQLRALIVTGGNPLITMPNAGRLREALEQLELLVVLDILPTETATIAHYALPCVSPLERPDLPFIFPLMLGLQSRPYLQATEAVVEPDGEQRDEGTIYADLARATGISLFGSPVAQRLLEAAMSGKRWLDPRGGRRVPSRALLDGLLRICGAPSFGELLGEPHGVLREPHSGKDFLGQRVQTPDGLVDLAPAGLVPSAEELERRFEEERAEGRRLRLITKRAVGTHNSWTHNHRRLSAEGTNHLYMHPDDAAAVGLRDGDLVDVTTETATVRLPLRFLRDLMPGSVALPHGWGHQHAKGLRIASQTRGVNVNLLAADGPGRLEHFSGMARLTAIPVEVRRAAGPQDPSSWSGLPASADPAE